MRKWYELKKETVLNEIIKYYIKSHDFNGLPVYSMKYYDYNILCELIDEGLIEVLSEKEVINPHIKGFDFNIPVDRQKENISKETNYSVLYPTRKTLESVPLDYTKPYSVLMQKGEKQFKIIYFNIEILERYVNNPKFVIMDNGYRGNICVKDEYIDDKTIEDEYCYLAESLSHTGSKFCRMQNKLCKSTSASICYNVLHIILARGADFLFKSSLYSTCPRSNI